MLPAGFFAHGRRHPSLVRLFAMNTTAITAVSPPRAKVITAFAVVYLIWGSTYLAIRIGVTVFPPFLMAGCRFLAAGGLMLAWLAWRGARLPTARQWKEAAITGTLLLLGGNGLVCWAEQTVNSSHAALILASAPIWFAVFDTIRPGGKRPKLATVLGIFVGTIGVALLVGSTQAHGSDGNATSLAGAGALLAACGLWAGGSLYKKYYTAPASPWMSTAAQMLCGGAANCVASVGRGEWRTFHPSTVTAAPVLAFVYLVLFGAIAGFSAYVWLLGHCAPAKVATYAYVNPLVATLLGWTILREPLTPLMGLAALTILGGVLIVQWPAKKVAGA